MSFDFLKLPSNDAGMPGVPVRRPRHPAIPGFDGNAIRAARTLLGHNIKELAEATGISDRTIGGWERGETVPTSGKIQPLIDYMARRNVSVEDAIRAARGDTGEHLDNVEQAIMADEKLPLKLREQLVRKRREMLDEG